MMNCLDENSQNTIACANAQKHETLKFLHDLGLNKEKLTRARSFFKVRISHESFITSLTEELDVNF